MSLEAVGLPPLAAASEVFPSLESPQPKRRLGEQSQAFAAYADSCEKIWKPGETTLEFASYPGPPNKCRGGHDPAFEVFDYENTEPPSGSEVVARFEAMGGGLFRIRFLLNKGNETKAVKVILWEVEQAAAPPSAGRAKETLSLLAAKANVDLQRYKIDAEERKHQREMEAQEKSLLVRNLESQVAAAQRELLRLRDGGSNTKEQSLLVDLLREQLRAAQEQAQAQRELVLQKESDAMNMFREIQAIQEKMRSEEVARYQDSLNQVVGSLTQVAQQPPPPPPPPSDESDKWAAILQIMQQGSQAAMQQTTALMAAMQQQAAQQAAMQAKASADQMALMLTLLNQKNAAPPPPAVDPTILTILTAQMQSAEARAQQMQASLFAALQEKAHPIRPTDAVNDLVKTMEAVTKLESPAGGGSPVASEPVGPPPPPSS